MKNLYFIFLFLTCSAFSQQLDSLYAISYKNLPSTPTSSTNAIVRVGKLNPTVGFVANVGTSALNTTGGFNLTGGSINQINNTFNLISSGSFRNFNLTTGNLIAQTPITSFSSVGTTIFDNVRFNNSDSTLYGLARINLNGVFQGMYLAKLNTTTGNLTQISANSVGNVIAIRGTVIDPDQMIYYYSDGPKLVGLDLYNGSIYSNPNYVFSNPEYFGFTNIAFNCSTSEIIGLIQGQTPGVNPLFPTNFIYYNRLAKINPTTGVVTEISPVNLPSQLFSLNAGSTIDEANGIYYYANAQTIFGVSLTTGLIVSTAPIVFEDGQTLNFLNNYNNCVNRTALRQNPAQLSNPNLAINQKINVYPNPTSSILKIKTDLLIEKVEIMDSNGRMVQSSVKANEINVVHLASGIYFLKIYTADSVFNHKFIKVD